MANEGGNNHPPTEENNFKEALKRDDDFILNQTGEDYSHYLPVDASNENRDHVGGLAVGTCIGAGQSVEMVEFTASSVEDNSPVGEDEKNESPEEAQKEEISVDQLADDLTLAYSGYLALHVRNEMNQFEENIEEMLTRLDEFLGLVDIIRADTSLCLNQTLPRILAKGHEMEQIFTRIDKLEAFVAMVKQQMNAMEEAVSHAENEMGSLSSIKKMFSSISMPAFLSKKAPPKQTPSKPKTKFDPPTIYRTEDYLMLENDKTPAVSAQSSEKSKPVTPEDLPKPTNQNTGSGLEPTRDAIPADICKDDQHVAS